MVFWDGELQCENLVSFLICLWVVLTSCLCFPFGCLLFLFRVVCISACLLVCAETLYVCLISAYYWPSGLADRNALEVTSTCPACLLVSVLSVCLSPCAILACLLVLFLYLYHAIPCNPMQYHWKSLKPCNTIKFHWIPAGLCLIVCLSVCPMSQVFFCLSVPCPMYLSVCPMSAFVRSVQEPAGERRAAMPGSSTGKIVTIAIWPFAIIYMDHQRGRRVVPAERRAGHNSDKR